MLDLVIVDDHPAVRAGLRGLLEDEEGLRVVATAATAREGFEAIADLRPAVALVDLHLPDDDGLSLCLRTRSAAGAAAGVIYSAFADAGLAVRAAIAGAEAVLPKSASPRAARPPSCAASCARRSTRARCGRSASGSTPPTCAILGMLAHGVAEREIAATLGLDAGVRSRPRRCAMLRPARSARRHRSRPPEPCLRQ